MSDLGTRQLLKGDRAKFRRRRFLAWLLVAIVVLAVALFSNRGAIRDLIEQAAGNDYSGAGHGKVSLVIQPGDSGADVIKELVKLDVVKNYSKTFRLIAETGQVFYPGTYQLRLQMSSRSALELIASPTSVVVNKVTIKEGLRIDQVFGELSKATGISKAEFAKFKTQPVEFGLPSKEVSLEGWLFPATYSFEPKTTAKAIISQMVSRMTQELDSFNVPKDKRHDVLTFASIVQKEARQAPDFYKVSRTFKNRLAINMPLQSDATVSYGSGGTTVTTTNAERANPNGYNTYVHQGLPIGPISAPGAKAIDAALHPANGKWLYFCAVNLSTGETVFSTTVAEHEVAVGKFRAWMAANPGWNG